MALNQPTILQTSRGGLFILVAVFLCALALSIYLARSYGPDTPFLPLTPYLALIAYALVSRRLIAGHHRSGCRAFRRGELDTAISEMEASYAFFQRRPWLDRFRSLTMLSASAMSYRELALLNIGFFQAQAGRKDESKAAYQRVVAEFPRNLVGAQTLKMIETFEIASPA